MRLRNRKPRESSAFFGGWKILILIAVELLVPKKGLEPPHPCEYVDLNHARLPIPPLRHGTQVQRSAEPAASLSLANAGCGVKFGLLSESSLLLARRFHASPEHFHGFLQPILRVSSLFALR